MKNIRTSVDPNGDVSTFLEHIESAVAGGAKSLLLLACEKNGFIPEQLDEMLRAIPIPVFGGIFPEIIHGKRNLGRGTLVTAFPYEVKVAAVGGLSDTGKDYAEVIGSIAGTLASFPTAFIFVDGAAGRIPAFLDDMYDQLGADICYLGGGSGFRDGVQKPCLFSNSGLLQDHAQIVGIPVSCKTEIAQGWQRLAGPFMVTESESNVIRTLDYRPAFAVYREIVERASRERSGNANILELFDEIAEPDSARHPHSSSFFSTAAGYPLGFEVEESEAFLYSPTSESGKHLVCMDEVPAYVPAHILKAEPEDLIRASENAGTRLRKNLPDLGPLFIFECFNRSLFLGDRLMDEIGALTGTWRKSAEVVGALTFGEIATSRNGRLVRFNESVVIGAIYEQESASPPQQIIPLVWTQYALAMSVRQEPDLIHSLRHFLTSALKLLSCRSGHAWLRDDFSGEGLLHRCSYPEREYKRIQDYPRLMESVANFDPSRPCILQEHNALFHLLPIGRTGVLVLRRNSPLTDVMVTAIHPILFHLENICQHAMRHAQSEKTKSLALQNEVRLNAELKAIRDAEEKLERLAHIDPLTNLPNRTQVAEDLNKAILHSDRSGSIFAIAFLDLDNFKSVNDRHGHEIGDRLLIEVARRLRLVLRGEDSIARLGGDEFVLLLTDIKDMDNVEATLNRILADLSAPWSTDSCVLEISTSIGVTVYPRDHSDSSTLLQHADQAMYLAKQSGRNRFQWFDSALDQELKSRHAKLEKLHAALQNGDLKLYYQPQIHLQTGEVIGLESLIRWQHPEEGLMNAQAFLPLIEQSQLNIQIGDWILKEAARQMSAWMEIGINLPVSVNISSKHLKYPGFVEKLKGVLAQYPKVSPSQLELEILETAVLDEPGPVKEIMLACRQIGIRFSLDDFGTGYSSLAYLKHLPVDTVKVDRDLIRDMRKNADDLSLIEGIINLAKIFSRMVIAEGVETEEHGVLLVRLGCEFGQGYGIARPMPPDEIPAWLNEFKGTGT